MDLISETVWWFVGTALVLLMNVSAAASERGFFLRTFVEIFGSPWRSILDERLVRVHSPSRTCAPTGHHTLGDVDLRGEEGSDDASSRLDDGLPDVNRRIADSGVRVGQRRDEIGSNDNQEPYFWSSFSLHG
jgi:hypothetical protein